MPVTKTAKRALRVSKRKTAHNKTVRTDLDVAIRLAKKSKKEKDIKTASSLADRAAKKNVIHTNKASRIKSSLSKLLQA
jgi:small subunit ribosomal protein S20